MQRGDIFLCNLNPIAGHEQAGRRPVFVLTPAAFNRASGTPVVLPITNGGSFARARGFAVELNGSGIHTTGVIRCDQPRALDFAARGASFIEAAPAAVVEEVMARVQALLLG